MGLYRRDREIQSCILAAPTRRATCDYLPKEKVVITGDAVIGWTPFMGDGYPEDWAGTLDRLAQLDFTHIIMGHGDVAERGWLRMFRGYVDDMVAAVRARSRPAPRSTRSSSASRRSWRRRTRSRSPPTVSIGRGARAWPQRRTHVRDGEWRRVATGGPLVWGLFLGFDRCQEPDLTTSHLCSTTPANSVEHASSSTGCGRLSL